MDRDGVALAQAGHQLHAAAEAATVHHDAHGSGRRGGFRLVGR